MTLDLRIDAVRAVVGGQPASVSLGIDEGRIEVIADLGADLPARSTVRLDADVVLLPGLVDTHVHVNEPGQDDWEGFASATRAARAGGITTIVDMPLDSLPVTTDVAALELKRSVAHGQCVVDVGFWGGLVPGNVGELEALWAAGVRGFKCFLSDSGTPEFPPVSPAELVEGMAETARLGAVLLVHAELDPGPAPSSRSYASFEASRPPAVEDSAVALVIDAVRRTGGRAHVVHLSSASALPLVAAAQAEGLAVSAETCPHYLTLTAEAVPDGATEFACCPPIRGEDNRKSLWAALAGGPLDLVVSDHSPCATELKALDSGDFGRAWGGISSLQLGLPVVWTEARARGFGLEDVVRWMSTAPAALAGYTDRGGIRVGARADLVAFDPDATWTVDAARLHHRQPVTPYDGRTVTGMVRRTWVAGA